MRSKQLKSRKLSRATHLVSLYRIARGTKFWPGEAAPRLDERLGPAYFVLSLAPLHVAAVFSVGLAFSRSNMNWGSAAEWLGAIGTFAAVALALGLAIGDARRRDSDRKDEQAAQARLITVDSCEEAVGGVLYVSVTNHSASPVFAVVVEAVHVTPDPLRVLFKGDRQWARLDPGTADSRVASCSRWTGPRWPQSKHPASCLLMCRSLTLLGCDGDVGEIRLPGAALPSSTENLPHLLRRSLALRTNSCISCKALRSCRTRRS